MTKELVEKMRRLGIGSMGRDALLKICQRMCLRLFSAGIAMGQSGDTFTPKEIEEKFNELYG